MEECVEREFKELTDSVGSMTKDPDADNRENDRKARAERLLKTDIATNHTLAKHTV